MATLDDLSVDQLNALYAQKTDPHVAAIHSIESGGADATANPVNPSSGASGSMQTMPATAARPGYGVKPSNGTPIDNTRTGVEYYQTLRDKYQDPVKAAVAYDWGPGNADKWIASGAKLDDLPLETLKYIQKFDQKTGAISGRNAVAAPNPAPVATTATPDAAAAPAQPAPVATPATPPQSFGQQLLHQAGRFANMAGHGISDALGLVANPVNALVNTAGNALGFHPGLKDVDTLLGNTVNQATPAPANDLEAGIGKVGAAVANPINIATAGMPAGGIARSAAIGLLGGANQPVHADTNLANYAGDVAAGGATGGALGMLGRVLAPQTSAAVQRLREEGIQPTTGQMGGRLADAVESGSTSVPLSGQLVRSARERADATLNRALYARALADVPNTVVPEEMGRAGVLGVKNQLSAAYNDVLPHMSFAPDQQFVIDMAPAARLANELPDNLHTRFTDILDDTLMNRLSGNGQPMTGEAMKEAESLLSRHIKEYGGPNASVDELKVSNALRATQQALRNALMRQNPQQAPILTAINNGYSVYARLRVASGMMNNPDQPITPQAFQRAVRLADMTQGKGAYATGQAPLSQIADDAASVMGRRVPDSGTPERSALIGLVTGGGALATGQLPSLLAGMGGQALYASRVGQAIGRSLIADRPDAVRAVGNVLPRFSGVLSGKSTQDQGTQQ